MDKIYITWEEFHKDTKLLCDKIKASGKYDKIIAVSRGGLIPAGIVSYELDIRMVEAVNVSSYDNGEQRSKENIEIKSFTNSANDKALVIDDLSDTGNTYRILKKLYPKATFTTVYAKPRGQADTDIFAKEVPDKWIVFPWD